MVGPIAIPFWPITCLPPPSPSPLDTLGIGPHIPVVIGFWGVPPPKPPGLPSPPEPPSPLSITSTGPLLFIKTAGKHWHSVHALVIVLIKKLEPVIKLFKSDWKVPPLKISPTLHGQALQPTVGLKSHPQFLKPVVYGGRGVIACPAVNVWEGNGS